MVNFTSRLKGIEIETQKGALESSSEMRQEFLKAAGAAWNAKQSALDEATKKNQKEEKTLAGLKQSNAFSQYELDIYSNELNSVADFDAAAEKAKKNIPKEYKENPNFLTKLEGKRIDLKTKFVKKQGSVLRDQSITQAEKLLEGDAISRAKNNEYGGAMEAFDTTTKDLNVSRSEKQGMRTNYISNLIDNAKNIEQLDQLLESPNLSHNQKAMIRSAKKSMKSSVEAEEINIANKDDKYLLNGNYNLLSPAGAKKYADTITWAIENNINNLNPVELEELSESLTGEEDSYKKWLVDAKRTRFNQEMKTDWIAASVARGRKIDPPPVFNTTNDITAASQSHAERFNYFYAQYLSWGAPAGMSNPLTQKEEADFKNTMLNPEAVSPDAYVEFVEGTLNNVPDQPTQIAHYFLKYMPYSEELSHFKYCPEIGRDYSKTKSILEKGSVKGMAEAQNKITELLNAKMGGLTDKTQHLKTVASNIAIAESLTRAGNDLTNMSAEELTKNRLMTITIGDKSYTFLKQDSSMESARQFYATLKKTKYVPISGTIKGENLHDYIIKNKQNVEFELIDLGSFHIKVKTYNWYGGFTGHEYIQDPAKSDKDGSNKLIISLEAK